MAPTMIRKGLLEQLGFAMWTPTTRQQHSRPVTRYQTDLTDAEWRVIAPHLPKPRATGWPREQFYRALRKVVWSDDFSPEQMAVYMRKKSNRSPDDHESGLALAIKRCEQNAWA